ncbi:MAG: choice-of-anchor J domain-containing protein [Prevotella sp.]|jgi:hypothetical protein
MRKLYLLLVALISTGFVWAQQPQTVDVAKAKSMIPEEIDPMNLNRTFDITLTQYLVPQNNRSTAQKPTQRKTIRRVDPVDTTQYFAVAQSYYSNYSFHYEGGDVLTYNVGVAVDGTKVTFSKLFNLYDPTAWSKSTDSLIVGTYDAANKTITIPTSTVFSEATIAGSIYNYYVGVLMAGTVNEDGKLTPDDNLIFHVEGNFERIYTDQSFGISEYTPDGSQSYGFYRMYRNFSLYLPNNQANLVTFDESKNLGEVFPGGSATDSVTLVNTGGVDADAIVEIESDDNVFATDNETLTIPAYSAKRFPVTFSAQNPSEYEGLATVSYDGGDDINVILLGTVIPQPDFTPIVKHGDFTFETNIEAPFRLDTLDNNQIVATSGTDGTGGLSSKLTITFTVPEGQMGKLSWKGMSNNGGQWYNATGGYFVDDMNTSLAQWQNPNTDIANTIELAPGQHQVRFQYDQYYYSGDENDRLYVYDLDLETETLKADSALLEADSIDLGNAVLQAGGTVNKTAYVVLRNKGSNALSITSVTSDNDEFKADKNIGSAATLEKLEMPVTLTTTTSGEKTAHLTIVTTAGTYNVTAKANVVDMPDFNSIVDEAGAELTWTTDENNPFIIENGIAYNITAGKPDYEYIESSFTASFTIPDGKMGFLSWDGHMDGTPTTVDNYWGKDRGAVTITHPMNTGVHDVWGYDVDAGSEALFGADDFWKDYLACAPGDHSITFMYRQGGDTIHYGTDRLEISHFKLHVVDYNEYEAELLTPSVEFDSTYVGPQRYTTATVSLHNLGSKALKVNSINNVSAFYGIVPEDSAKFNQNLDVTLWFFPTEEGEFKDSITISTNCGDFKVECQGRTKNSEGLILIGDFEDAAYGWTTYDGNNDGETWDLGSNLWGENPNYVHSGLDCLASISYSNNLGSITPDNWTFSPNFDVPAEGAVLTYYISAFHPERYAEHYSLYVTSGSTVEEITADTATYEETINTPTSQDESGYVLGWELRTIDLKPWAGKNVKLAFRHYDCTGQYILRLDDVFVKTNDRYNTDGINTVKTQNGNVVSRSFYDLNGRKLSSPVKGINIVKSVYSDGTVKTQKLIVK